MKVLVIWDWNIILSLYSYLLDCSILQKEKNKMSQSNIVQY